MSLQVDIKEQTRDGDFYLAGVDLESFGETPPGLLDMVRIKNERFQVIDRTWDIDPVHHQVVGVTVRVKKI